MPYRKFDTGTWQDPWFENLDSDVKLAFIYFWTNEICNQSGIYEISEKRIFFELGYHIDTISIPLKPKIIWYPDKKIIWVKNFFKRQCQNNKFAISAINNIKEDPFKLQLFMAYNKPILEGYGIDIKAYHIDTISIPYPTEQNSTVQYSTETETVTEREKEKKTKRKKQVFSPPTQTDVENYFIENGFSKISGSKAWNYYNTANWKDARGNQVQNWKQKMISIWFKDENKIGNNNGPVFVPISRTDKNKQACMDFINEGKQNG